MNERGKKGGEICENKDLERAKECDANIKNATQNTKNQPKSQNVGKSESIRIAECREETQGNARESESERRGIDGGTSALLLLLYLHTSGIYVKRGGDYEIENVI